MDFLHLFNNPHTFFLVKLILIGGIAPALLFWFSEKVHRAISMRFSPQEGMVVSKIIRYTGIVFLFILLLKELGFSLTPLLGAAGIVGIALGIAAQTSTSNIISGIFLLAERPFQVGDSIQVNNTVGEVMTVDLLAVKLKTPDNKFVRIPNESMLKGEVVNLTKFGERRIDFTISVGYGNDLEKMQRILLEEIKSTGGILSAPEPKALVTDLTASAVNFTVHMWVKTKNTDLRSVVLAKIKARLDREKIEIPLPHLVVRTEKNMA